MSEPSEQHSSDVNELAQAIREQTAAISQLANSNAMLAQAIADSYDESGESAPSQYLDGTSAQ